MTITLTNDFHNTSVKIRAEKLPHTITEAQGRGVRKALCGVTGCTCGGIRGPQYGPDGQRLDWERDWEKGPFDDDDYAAIVLSERRLPGRPATRGPLVGLQTNIRVDVAAALTAIAAQTGTSKAQLIEQAVMLAHPEHFDGD